jgi:chemotaxis protein MotB
MTGRRLKRHRGQKDDKSWLLTFNDLITLLLTFFVLIISMSSLQREKLEELSLSLRQALIDFGAAREVVVFTPFVTKPIVEEIEQKKLAEAQEKQKEWQERTRRLIENLQVIFQGQEGVFLAATPEGVEVILAAELLFSPGEARLNDEQGYLKQMASLFSPLTADIIIESYHLAPKVSQTPGWDGPWELAGARAGAVLRGFLAEDKIKASLFGLSAYGYHRAMPDNATPAGLAEKDVVRILLKYIDE